MYQSGRGQLVLYVLLAIAIGVLGARVMRQPASSAGATALSGARRAPASPANVRVDRAAGGELVVHVAGAVRRPGVYRMRSGARVQDALRRAGGATAHGDPNTINLAARLTDGQQVLIPARAPAASSGATAGAQAATGAPAGTPVDLNSATAEQLDTLDGVGPVTAQKILEWRAAHGGFRSVEDLNQIPGIGPKRLAALRPHVRI